MKKIGIFSGTFDPIHNGHISFASKAMNKYGLDKVFFLPEPRPRRKQGVKAFERRVEMVRLALKDQPNMASLVLKHSRFTVQRTLPVLKNRFKDAHLFLLIGEDMLDHLSEWPHIDELTNIGFIVGVRKRILLDIKNTIETICQIKGIEFEYYIFRAPNFGVSSSNVRSALRHGYKPLGIDPDVQAYISANNLYSISAE